MQPLINDIILPAEHLRMLDRIKNGLGIAGAASTSRDTDVPPLAAEFMEIQTKIDEVTRFVRGLSKRHVRDEEMPEKAINVARVNYLVEQVRYGGFLGFVINSRWDESFVAGVRSGLAAIGATEHLAVFDGAASLIDEAFEKGGGKLDSNKLKTALYQLEREHFSNAKLSGRLSRIVDSSWTPGDRWQCVQMLSVRYIAGWKGVKRVPAAAYAATLDNLAARIPDLAARRQMREDGRPWEKKAIDCLAAQASFTHLWYMAFSIREYNGKKVWCWNFTVGTKPGQGLHQVIFVDGEAIMFKGNTDTIVARMLAPECAPGSAVARNEPDKEPGMEHRNISFRIPNP